jgi:hypothetical protein
VTLTSWFRIARDRIHPPASERARRVEPYISIPWRRWSDEEREGIKRQLEAIGPDNFTEDDLVKIVEFWIQTYLPDDTTLKTEDDLHKVIGRIRADIRRQKEMTAEERTTAAKDARASVSPEFITWLDEQLSRVSPRPPSKTTEIDG